MNEETIVDFCPHCKKKSCKVTYAYEREDHGIIIYKCEDCGYTHSPVRFYTSRDWEKIKNGESAEAGTKKEELTFKKCPFCGGKEVQIKHAYPDYPNCGHIVWAECLHCGCRTRAVSAYRIGDIFTGEKKVQKIWNERIEMGE